LRVTEVGISRAKYLFLADTAETSFLNRKSQSQYGAAMRWLKEFGRNMTCAWRFSIEQSCSGVWLSGTGLTASGVLCMSITPVDLGKRHEQLTPG